MWILFLKSYLKIYGFLLENLDFIFIYLMYVFFILSSVKRLKVEDFCFCYLDIFISVSFI